MGRKKDVNGTGVGQEVNRFNRHRVAMHNLWEFFSPKNDRRFMVVGDLPYFFCIVTEGDTSVHKYAVETEFDSDGEPIGTSKVRTWKREGAVELWLFPSGENAGRLRPPQPIQALLPSQPLVTCHIFTDLDARSNRIQYENWLILTGLINRVRSHFTPVLAKRLAALLDGADKTVRQVLDESVAIPRCFWG